MAVKSNCGDIKRLSQCHKMSKDLVSDNNKLKETLVPKVDKMLSQAGSRSAAAQAEPHMSDRADTAQAIIRPPIAWALAVLAGLTLNWLMPLPFVPGMLPAGWLGATVFALALVLVA
jgi:hypothetical protein